MILHPRDYQFVRNLATLRVELGDRAARHVLDSFAMALTGGIHFVQEGEVK